MGRPREFNETTALEQAMHLFWSKGYEATSLQELLGTMRLSKSSFYQTFGSKHQLLERSIEHYRQLIVDEMTQNLEQAGTGLQFIQQMLLAVAEKADKPGGRRGCLVMNCASEFGQNDPVIAGLVADGTRHFKLAFQAGVEQAQREGDIPGDKDASLLAHYLVSCKSGLETMTKAGATRHELEDMALMMISALPN